MIDKKRSSHKKSAWEKATDLDVEVLGSHLKHLKEKNPKQPFYYSQIL